MRKHNLKPGPIRHKELSPDIISRIGKVSTALAGLLPMTEAEWIDGLQRDLNPEQEVVWWERVAQVYQDFSQSRTLSPNEKQAAFKIIFGLLSGLEPSDLERDLAKLPDVMLSDLMASMSKTLKIDELGSTNPIIH